MAWLERVWRRDVTIAGLPLAEPDEADLALDLAVRDVPRRDADSRRPSSTRFRNPDRKARFAFIMPAVSGDAAVRDRVLRRPEGRQEPRARGLGPRRRAVPAPSAARGDVAQVVGRRSGCVREIQRTGDIFFPKRWADATLGGYQSAEVAADVRAFIDELPPDYPPRLRWVLLSAADPLFRAARQ